MHMVSDTSGGRSAPVRLVVVGGGPRALGVLERLAASAELLEGRDLRIDLVEPHMPGAGRIWSAEESPLLLMNSRAADVTIHTDETVTMEGPVVPGPTLAEWAEGIRSGRIPAPTAATGLKAEIEALTEGSFASRRLQALYLESYAGEVLASLPGEVSVHLHRTVATGIGPEGRAPAEPVPGDGDAAIPESGASTATPHPADGWRIDLADGPALHADLVVLATGHTDARLTPARHELAAFARRHGGAYVPPSQARDADLSVIGAGQEVIVRGMGLGFVDLLSLLTQGRGGHFEPCPTPAEPGRLRYLPSGEEPRLWVGSRRGAPYHSKVTGEDQPAGPRDLAFVTDERLRAAEDAEGTVRFTEDVLPLIAAEIARAVPGVPGPEEDPQLAWLDDPLRWLVSDRTFEPRGLVPPCDVRRLTRDAVVRHIENDLAARTVGDTHDARALFQVLLRITGALVTLLPASRLHADSAGAYPTWWHSVFSFVDSGPPPHRLHQLLALERAGIVRFLGPRLRVEADETSGLFVAEGGTGARAEATALIDAFLPEQTLADSANPLLRDLVRPRGVTGRDEVAAVVGDVRADVESAVAATAGALSALTGSSGALSTDALSTGAPTTGASSIGREAPGTRGLLEIDAEQRVVGPDGTPRAGLWAIGPWTSELPVGAFSRPRTNSPVFRRNDALARQLLRAAAAGRERAAADDDAPEHPVAPASIGIVGPGRIGTAIGRLAVRSGLDVRIAGRLPLAELHRRIPGARAVPRPEIGRADVVVLTVPLHVALRIDPAELAGAVVIDATNAWGEQDAQALARLHTTSTSEALAAHLVDSRVVKTLNHIGYHDVEEHMHLAGAGARRALAVAGDDAEAVARAAGVLDLLGFEPVPVGPLADGVLLQPDGSLFSSWRTRDELEAALDDALLTALVHRDRGVRAA